MYRENLPEAARTAKELEDALFDGTFPDPFRVTSAERRADGAVVLALAGEPGALVARQGPRGAVAWVDDGYGRRSLLCPRAAELLLDATEDALASL